MWPFTPGDHLPQVPLLCMCFMHKICAHVATHAIHHGNISVQKIPQHYAIMLMQCVANSKTVYDNL